ncbi:Kin of IRRE-like protein 3 [Frankliniella fusca]|uniref:Kin of IRRE-like protein 3 n=1 Tax=Frankliniella fusca TaxID=407009 RepID=A0AAE1HUZ0_9NEOP|nr:Kin of IRRE-like protein 3 [Frankliniella fusca]
MVCKTIFQSEYNPSLRVRPTKASDGKRQRAALGWQLADYVPDLVDGRGGDLPLLCWLLRGRILLALYEQDMMLPKDGPHITGGKPKYRVDEDVDVLCSVNRSKPAASLLWFINGEVADQKLLRGPYKSVSAPDGLETAILGLHFKVEPRHFQHGDMKLKCLASVATVYWKSNEESIEGDKLRPPALESKGNIGGGRSRADMVQAAGCRLGPLAVLVLLASSTATLVSR